MPRNSAIIATRASRNNKVIIVFEYNRSLQLGVCEVSGRHFNCPELKVSKEYNPLQAYAGIRPPGEVPTKELAGRHDLVGEQG